MDAFDNDAWLRFARELHTSHTMLRRALESGEGCDQLVRRYQKAIKSYVIEELLLREKQVEDRLQAESIANQIFDLVLTNVSAIFLKGWQKDPCRRFRSELVQWVHEAHYEYLYPRRRPIQVLDESIPHPPEIKVAITERQKIAWARSYLALDLLRKAKARLEQFQREHAKNDNIFYTLWCLQEQFPDEPVASLQSKLASIAGRELAEDNLRQQLHRAHDLYGRLLLEEIQLTISHDVKEVLLEEIESLGLMAYLLKSAICREKLGLDKAD